MDGSRFIFLSLAFTFCLSQSFAKADPSVNPSACDWSQGKLSKKDKNFAAISAQSAQVQAFLQNTSSCSRPLDFDTKQNLALGAYQALAIAHHSCDLPANQTYPNMDQFLYKAMKLQGLELYPNVKDPAIKNPSSSDPLSSKDLYKLAGDAAWGAAQLGPKIDWCFDPVGDNLPLQAGDILVGQDATLVIDSVGNDPFGFEKKIAKNPKKLKVDPVLAKAIGRNGAILDLAHHLCEGWILETKDFDITVSYAGGKAKMFPTFGGTNTTWLTAMSIRANNQCVAKLSQSIIDANFPDWHDFTAAHNVDNDAIRVLSPSKESTCHLTRAQMPADTTDTACVQFCKEDSK